MTAILIGLLIWLLLGLAVALLIGPQLARASDRYALGLEEDEFLRERGRS